MNALSMQVELQIIYFGFATFAPEGNLLQLVPTYYILL